MRRKLALLLVIVMVLGMMPMQAFAAVIGSDDDGNIVITDIKYAISHDVFTVDGGFIEILGTNLEGIEVLFEEYGKGFVQMGLKSVDTDTFVKYTLTAEEAKVFSGRIRVGSLTINLETSDFPNLQSSDKQTVNIDDPQPYDITFYGNFLNNINTGDITGVFGTGISTNSLGTTANANSLVLTNPTNPGRLGYQNIILNKTNNTSDPKIEIEYTYSNVFRIIEDLNLSDVTMFPNTGSKGDEVYFTGDNFSDTRNYQVYFLKALDGSDKYTATNKADFVSLGLNVDGAQDVLTVKVPSSVDFERRNYYVVITDTLNGQIVAEQVVTRSDGSYDQYTVIESGFKPTIEAIYPEKGPDTGGSVQISGRNLVTLNIPDLVASGAFLNDPTTESAESVLVLNYTDGTYKNDNVSIERKMNIQIAKKTTFAKDVSGDYQIIKGIPDSLIVNTDVIDDAETDPLKDVVIEIETTLTVLDNANGNLGKKFIFNQIVTREDGFEFEPSTYTPNITDMVPSIIQVEDTSGGYVKFKNETLIAIHGDKFLVDRYVDENGEIVTHLPTVLVKKNDNNTFNSRYQLGFFPNETYTGGGKTITGIIKYKDDETGGVEHVLVDEDGAAIPLDMVVLNDENEEVNGVSGNDLGTKIVIIVPENALLKDIGIKHLQVTNPTRDSTAYGKSSIKSDFIEFIKTSDIPVIESVEPNIITVEGGEEIVVTGSNIQDGVLVYLDGEPITGFTRELDTTGTKILVKFEAPPGREGLTQLQLVNPSGGMAVADFIYVDTFNEAPVITNFTPTLGSYDTLVVVNGDNFLKPDPTAASIDGIDAYRLIGSRILLDGEEVNGFNYDIYGNVEFIPYTAPNELTLITNSAGKAVYNTLYENTTVIDTSDSTVVTLGNDKYNNPAIITATESYGIRYNGSGYDAYTSLDVYVGATSISFDSGTGVTTIDINGGPTFEASMNNTIIRKGTNTDNVVVPYLADYAESVILTDGTSYYTLSYNFAGDIILTNGKDKVYTVKINSGNFVGVDVNNNQRPISVDSTGLTIDGTPLTMMTAYTVNATTGAIEGHKVKVLSKNQMIFTVPYLASGKGYKDLVVVNPDTKNDGRYDTDGFYYVAQATSTPAITAITPERGSVDGGYYVIIDGNEFEDDVKVYIDSVLVPASSTYVALDGSYIKIMMPASQKDLVEDYGVDELAVPVVIVNPDGGAAYREKGFTYIIPQSDPVISSIIPDGGSSNGGDIVEIIGYEFRFYEPYENLVGGPSYELGDKYEDLYANGVWDNLLASGVDPSAITQYPELTNDYYDYYYESKVLPKVYFGENEAHIVEFSKGYIKVITPTHASGTVDVYVINNDSGVSNKVKFTYETSSPKVTRITPNFGKRSGNEPKDIYGTNLYKSLIYGYIDDDESQIQLIPNVDAIVRFGEIDNRDIARTEPNSGLINSQRTTVSLDGGLSVSYYGDQGQVKLTLTENNVIYTRTFTYDNSVVYVPTGMLQNANGDYYVPNGLKNVDATVYSGDAYEYVRLQIEDRRLYVERGYAPEVIYDNDTHVKVYTPPYHTIDTVKMTYTNTDGGLVQTSFTYTNPDSEPKILYVEPKTLTVNEDKWYVESSIDGGVDIEIVGEDFRENVIVYIGSYLATIKELTTKTVNGIDYDLIVATVPKGSLNDVDQEYPFIIQNEDKGLATSSNLEDLIGTNYGAETLPFYFVYKKPLSNPRIDTVYPEKTSIYGGNTITITGHDFRAGAYVVIGTRAGIPIYDATISNDGTVITFVTPTNMTLGEKNIQVLNTDYGIAVKENALTVVSAPTVNPGITDENGRTVKHIDVTGGEKITITGTQFQEGATVYFGGVWTKTESGSQSEEGIYRDDSIYYVADGSKATNVEFVSSTELIVTTPVVDYEGEIKIVVLNPDGGISNDSTDTEYTVPIPDDPTGLKVRVVNNQYIQLYNYISEDADYFEIYVYIGTKKDTELTTVDNYSDFDYLGITNIEPYKILELPGFEDVKSAERIVFVLKAVNKFGPSGWSNVASLKYEDIEDVEQLGPEDFDGDLTVPDGDDYEIITSGNSVNVNLNDSPLSSVVNIDVTDDVTGNTTLKKITLPEAIVFSSLGNINVDFGNSFYRFSPVSFASSTFRSLANFYDAYALLQEDTSMNSARSYLQPNIRGKKQVSDVFSISFAAANNYETQGYNNLVSTIDFAIVYDDSFMSVARETQISLYKYNTSSGTYERYNATLDTSSNTVTARITTAGHYVLLTNY